MGRILKFPSSVSFRYMTHNILAQLIAFTPRGATLAPDEEAFITRNRISSFVLFARNIPDLQSARQLIARLHELAERPLIAVDQEGGRVIRLPDPATHLPSAMTLGATHSPDLAFRAGQATARELRALNLNVVLAPVLDVNNNPQNPVIGTRAFGDTPNLVSEMGTAWLRGAQSEGVAACAKHFPGHGDTRVDSHEALPRIDKSRAELERVELAPFRAAIEAGVQMVMPGHLLMSALDDACPASLSQPIITGLLRDAMQFNGVVITDALDMHAVALQYGIPGAAFEAARAGCDLLCVITQHEETLAALQRAVDDGSLAIERIEQSVQRITQLRQQLAASPSDPAWLGASTHRALAHQIARAAIRVHDTNHLLPLRAWRDTFVVEFALGRATIAEGAPVAAGKLLARLRESAPTLNSIALPFNPDDATMRDVITRASDAHTLVIATRQTLHFDSQQRLVAQLLALGKPTVLIALRDPYDLALFPQAHCTVATFDDSPAMLDEMVAVLM